MAHIQVLKVLVVCALAIAGWGCSHSNNGVGGVAATRSERVMVGEQLVRLHCQQCHQVHTRLSGPALAGVGQRWEGHEQDLIDFIRNSQEYMNANRPKSAYVRALYEAANKMVMPPTPLEDDEIRKILEYIAFAEQQPAQ